MSGEVVTEDDVRGTRETRVLRGVIRSEEGRSPKRDEGGTPSENGCTCTRRTRLK